MWRKIKFAILFSCSFLTLIAALAMIRPEAGNLWGYIITLLISLVLYFCNYFLIQDQWKNVGTVVFISLLILCLIFPGAGNLVVLFCVASSTLWLRPYRDTSNYEMKQTKESIFSEATQKKKPVAISEILNHDDEVARRKATLSLRTMNPKFAIPILNRAVQDSDEEVRLYATNILKKFNEQKEKRIQALHKFENPITYNRLAEEHMDSVYIGLADDVLAEQLEYEKASKYLEKSLTVSRTPKKLYRLLKLKIFRKEIESAEVVLDELISIHYPRHLLRPWEAEIAYCKKDWKSLLRVLGEIEPVGSSNSINIVRRQWLTEDERFS